MTNTSQPLDDALAQWSTAPPAKGTLPFPRQRVPALPPKWSAPLADAPAEDVWKSFEEVKIGCTMTMCEADLHCFRLTKKLADQVSPGTCRECGKLLISMERTAERDLQDIDATFAALQRECIRHYFWHVPWGQRGINYALRKGRIRLEAGIQHRVHKRIGESVPYRDGTQTPTSRERADAYDYALHAVAACCRRCVQYWHGIPTGRPLEQQELSYLSELVRRYLQARLPNLPDGPSKVSSIRRRAEVHHIAPDGPTKNPEPASVMRQPHAS